MWLKCWKILQCYKAVSKLGSCLWRYASALLRGCWLPYLASLYKGYCGFNHAKGCPFPFPLSTVPISNEPTNEASYHVLHFWQRSSSDLTKENIIWPKPCLSIVSSKPVTVLWPGSLSIFWIGSRASLKFTIQMHGEFDTYDWMHQRRSQCFKYHLWIGPESLWISKMNFVVHVNFPCSWRANFKLVTGFSTQWARTCDTFLAGLCATAISRFATILWKNGHNFVKEWQNSIYCIYPVDIRVAYVSLQRLQMKPSSGRDPSS